MSRLDKRFPNYSRLLKIYPPIYRQKYGDQMLQTLADMLDDKQNSRVGVWLRTALDFPLSLAKENIMYMRGIMTHETPGYVKRSSQFGALLLTPFFTFIILDSLTSHRLYSTWLWKSPVIGTWLILMPVLAFFICSGTFLRWSVQRWRQKHIGFWHSLID